MAKDLIEVRWTLQIPRDEFQTLRDIAEKAEVPITSVVKMLLRTHLGGCFDGNQVEGKSQGRA